VIGRRSLLMLAATAALGGCATPLPPATPAAPDAEGGGWTGRLSLRVRSEPEQSLSAAFELRGTASSGELLLSTPLGSTLARLRWSPGQADLQTPQESRQFASIGAMAQALTGTDLPLEALFEWLAGRPTAAAGWTVDLSQHAQGRLAARRDQPAPAAELRLAFEASR
jgi:outer membrane lipoprotein LolB